MPICLKKKKGKEKERKQWVNTPHDCLLGKIPAFKEPPVQWETSGANGQAMGGFGDIYLHGVMAYKGPSPGQALC